MAPLPLEEAPFETEAVPPSTPATIDMLEQDIAAAAPARRSWRERLAGSGFARGLASVFVRHPRLDDAFLDELETCLISADVGVATATEIVDDLRRRAGRREFADVAALLAALRADAREHTA
ncbi:MAG: signal recognition particle receptor subunit alpha, partial [Dokdonella sp.]|nr:signal recognition particle receptor subunit alpha [Dokdonella sp.]